MGYLISLILVLWFNMADKNTLAKILLLLALGLLTNTLLLAQPRFGNEQGALTFRSKEMMINPAYTGSINEADRRLSLGTAWQWVGMDGAPKAQDVQFQMGIPNAGGVGAWLYHDSYGVTSIIQLGTTYGYSIRLTNNHNLSLGANLSALMVNENQIRGIDDPSDPIFAANNPSKWGTNAGFGAMLYSNSYYVGFSMPQLLTNSWEEDVIEAKLKNKFKFNQLRFYLTGGYVLELPSDFSLIPSILLQFANNTNFGYELMVRGDYNKQVALGIGYGYDKALKAETSVLISKGIHLGYRYEQSFGKTYKNLSSSHSITLSIVWNREQKKNTRLF